MQQVRGKMWVANVVFRSNNASIAGAIRLNQLCFPYLHNATFEDNFCSFHAGALLIDNVVDDTNCHKDRQQRRRDENLLLRQLFIGVQRGNQGAAKTDPSDYPLLNNVTFARNHATAYGGAIYLVNFVGR